MTECRTNRATLEKRESDAKFRTYNKMNVITISHKKENKLAFQIEAHGVCEVRGGVKLYMYLGACSS